MLKKIPKINNLKNQIFRFNGILNNHRRQISPHQFYSFSVWQKVIDHPYSRLCRYNTPIGCMLLYWPVTWGLAIGATTFPRTLIIIQQSQLLFYFSWGLGHHDLQAALSMTTLIEISIEVLKEQSKDLLHLDK